MGLTTSPSTDPSVVTTSHRLGDEHDDPFSREKVVNAGNGPRALSESLYPSAISAAGWSVYGAQRAQPVATGRKWEAAKNDGKEGVDGSSPSEGS